LYGIKKEKKPYLGLSNPAQSGMRQPPIIYEKTDKMSWKVWKRGTAGFLNPFFKKRTV
jgi:hypothetical protein